ncbi:HNH endonuclease, partial [Vibrio cholerae]
TRDICRVSDWDIYALKERHENLKRSLKELWLVK